MGRTVMLAGLLMMAGFVGMIMLNLSHAHSELDSVQTAMEMQSRDVKMLSQANGQMALEMRSKLSVLDDLQLKLQQQQSTQEEFMKQLSTFSSVQDKLGQELEKLDPRIEELKQKVTAEEQGADSLTDEVLDLKEALGQVKTEVTGLISAVERLAQAAPEVPPAEPAVAAASRENARLKLKEPESELQDKGEDKTEDQEESPAATEGAEGAVEGQVEAEETEENAASQTAEPRQALDPGVRGLKLAGPKASPTELPFSGSESEVSQVLWFTECGCTGIEIEAVSILRGLVARLGTERVRTNKCGETCKWPADVNEVLEQIRVDEDNLFPSPYRESSPHATVLVMHAAYLGTCGMNAQLQDVLKGPAGRKGLVLISRSMVEVDKLDEGRAELCHAFDSIWVPSAQSREAFVQSGVSKDRIKVLPEAVDTSAFTCDDSAKGRQSRESFRSGSTSLDAFLGDKRGQSFTFLSMFKWEPRKNWDGLMDSFLEAFPQPYTSLTGPDGESLNISVRLLIKTQILSWSNDDPRQDVPQLLREKGLEPSSLEGRLLIFHDSLESSLVPKLFKAVDGFILPTHGEGWGLPLMEAMASGIPTIATGWGGHMDFMNTENSWPVSFELVDSPNDGARWAQPNKNALVEAMREVVAGGHQVREKVERACGLVHHKYHIEAVATQAVALMVGLLSEALQEPVA